MAPKTFKTVLLALAGFVSGGCAAPGDSLAAVGGRRLHYELRGAGAPAVVFEAGLGDPGTLAGWDGVVAEVAKEARTLVYDRAGLGGSDRGPLPRDSRSIAADLHALLAAAGLPPPYVLVGHSLGGLHVRVFADMYPGEVAGFVLVDPTPAEFLEVLGEDRLDALAAAGVPSGSLDEVGAGLAASIPEFAALGKLPPLPLAVITSGKEGAAADPAVGPARWEALRAAHEDLAAESPIGFHLVAAGTGHYVQRDAPGLVADAVLRVLAAARNGAGAR